jgi:predicted nucleic acid-binding protein
MMALDTNVLVRFIVEDDKTQSARTEPGLRRRRWARRPTNAHTTRVRR